MLEVHTSYLRYARRKAHLSLVKAAKMLDVNKSTLCRYENGSTRVKANTLLKMSAIYNIPLDDLLKETCSM